MEELDTPIVSLSYLIPLPAAPLEKLISPMKENEFALSS